MPNRLLCAVLEEMRDCAKTLNFSYLPGLIEEAQSLGSRMESKLFDIKDFDRLHEEIRDLKKKKKKLKEEVEELEECLIILPKKTQKKTRLTLKERK